MHCELLTVHYSFTAILHSLCKDCAQLIVSMIIYYNYFLLDFINLLI